MLELMRKFLTYGLTGGSAAIVDLGGFALLVSAGLKVGYAALVSFGVATLFNYVLTSRYVFRTKPSSGQYVRFLAAALLGAGINIGVTVLVANWLGLQPVLGKASGIAVAFVFNFVLNVTLVFRAAPVSSPGE